MHRFASRLPAPDDAPVTVPAPAPAPAGCPRALLRRDGGVWTVGLGTERAPVKHAKGLSFLAALLAHPGQERHVLDLAQLDAPDLPRATVGEALEAGLAPAALGDAGVLLDAEARAAYKRRLDDLRDEIDEAERFQDAERAARARAEMEFLGDELSRAVGLGGRDRRAASAAERARVNVSRAIAHAVRRIAEVAPLAGEHLQASVRTGLFCAYEPRLEVEWEIVS